MRYHGNGLGWADKYERAYRTALPRVKTEWVGRRVAVRVVSARGNMRKRTQYQVIVGILIPAPAEAVCGNCQRTQGSTCDHLVCVDEGTYVTRVHYTKVDAVYDLTRKVTA